MLARLRSPLGALPKLGPVLRRQHPWVGLATAHAPFLPMDDCAGVDHGTIDMKTIRYFPGFQDASMPSVKIGAENGFPHVVMANQSSCESISDWGTYCRRYSDDYLLEHGAIIFKGLPLADEEAFGRFFQALGYNQKNYEGGLSSRPRTDGGDFYLSSDEHPGLIIEPHNEQSYMPDPPNKIAFFAVRPADPGCGGENLICDNRKLIRSVNSKFADKVARKKIRYIRNCPDKSDARYKPWQETFYTEDKKNVEETLKMRGQGWEWKENNWLQFWQTLDAFRKHPITGEDVWFNQLPSCLAEYYRFHPKAETWASLEDGDLPSHATYGDGEEFEVELNRNLRQATYRNCVAVNLEHGDFMILDNFRAQHARMPFTGERVLITTLITD